MNRLKSYGQSKPGSLIFNTTATQTTRNPATRLAESKLWETKSENITK